MSNNYYVYLHRRSSDDKVFYVGKGKDDRCISIYNRNKKWVHTAKKHGFYYEIVFENLSETEAYDIEKDVILEMRYHVGDVLCNIASGGRGVLFDRKNNDNQLHKPKISREELKLLRRGLPVPKETPMQKYLVSMKVFSQMRKILEGQKPIKVEILEKIQNLPPYTLRKKSKGVGFSREAIAKSVATRKGKPAWNSGKQCPHLATINNPSADPNVYTFASIRGEIFVGTRYELCEKYNIPIYNLGKLFYKKPNKSCAGWRLVKEVEDGSNQET
jgi:hypothetical protein